MRIGTKLKLYGAVIHSDEVGSDFALVLAATKKDALTYVQENAPKQAAVEILSAKEMLWEQYRGFAVLTTDSPFTISR